jgi:hypothetical protein
MFFKKKKQETPEERHVFLELFDLLNSNETSIIKDPVDYDTTVSCVTYGTLNTILNDVTKIDRSMNVLYNDRSAFPYKLLQDLYNNSVIRDTGEAYLDRVKYVLNQVVKPVRHREGLCYKDIESFDLLFKPKKFNSGIGPSSRYRKYSEVVKLIDGLEHASLIMELLFFENSRWNHNTLSELIIQPIKARKIKYQLTSEHTSPDKITSAINSVLNTYLMVPSDACLALSKVLNDNTITSPNGIDMAVVNYCRVELLYAQIWNILHSLLKEVKPTVRVLVTGIAKYIKKMYGQEALSVMDTGDDVLDIRQLRLELDITDLQGDLFLSSDMVVGTESLQQFMSDAGKIGAKILKISKDLFYFSLNVKDFIMNKIVSEKMIHDKSAKVLGVIRQTTMKRAYVQQVPSFQNQRARFLNLIKVVNYIQKVSTQPIESFPQGDAFIDNIVDLAGGVFAITTPSKGSSFKNLKWNPPALTDYEVLHSPWNNESNMNQIKGLSLTCKYDMVEKLKATSIEMAKRCEKAAKDYSQQMGSFYEEDEDDGMERERLQSEMAALYTLGYSIGKATRQVLKEGLQKEINMFTTKYLSRLAKLKYK